VNIINTLNIYRWLPPFTILVYFEHHVFFNETASFNISQAIFYYGGVAFHPSVFVQKIYRKHLGFLVGSFWFRDKILCFGNQISSEVYFLFAPYLLLFSTLLKIQQSNWSASCIRSVRFVCGIKLGVFHRNCLYSFYNLIIEALWSLTFCLAYTRIK